MKYNLAVLIVASVVLLVNVQGGKLLPSFDFVHLSDYRFGLGDPYLIFYERENYRGKVHYHRLGATTAGKPGGCSNLDPNFTSWASSVDLLRRCVKLCNAPDCGGTCTMVLPDTEPKSSRGVAKLEKYAMNDAVMSVKYCYT